MELNTKNFKEELEGDRKLSSHPQMNSKTSIPAEIRQRRSSLKTAGGTWEGDLLILKWVLEEDGSLGDF